mgnify:CR=1 FL=1
MCGNRWSQASSHAYTPRASATRARDGMMVLNFTALSIVSRKKMLENPENEILFPPLPQKKMTGFPPFPWY